MNIGAVILAAGYSSRMGGFKPLMQLGGMSLLCHCAERFKAAGITDITVVTGHRREAVEAESTRLNVKTVHNPDYDHGMLSSVCSAVHHLHHLDGFFLLPVDIPLVYPATLTRLIRSFDGHSVRIPIFCGEEGHPPLIPTSIIPAILEHGSRGSQGGLRAVLAVHPGLTVPVWDRGVLMDGDTPEDFAALQHRFAGISIGEPEEAMALAGLLMPEKGITHGLAAAKIARQLGEKLNASGYTLNLNLLHNAALLHDVGKGFPDHEAKGAMILAELGLHGLTDIVAAHRSVPPPADGRLTEKEIVCLADKLVRGCRRVSIHERFSEKLDRYSDDPQACMAIRRRLTEVLAIKTLVEQQTGCSLSDSIAEGVRP